MRSVKRKRLSSTLVGARVEFPDWPSDSTPTIDRSPMAQPRPIHQRFLGNGSGGGAAASPCAAARGASERSSPWTPHSPGRRGSLPESGLRLRVADHASGDSSKTQPAPLLMTWVAHWVHLNLENIRNNRWYWRKGCSWCQRAALCLVRRDCPLWFLR